MLKVITIPAISFAGLILGLKLQKSAARAGRYVAKREIEKDPMNFIGTTDEQLKEVSHIKAQKESLGKKFVNYITFLPRTIKEYIEYKKYTKTAAKQNRELLDELTKLEVSDKQLADAKNLQRKMFNTFEKVDEGSQQYSESMEAATTLLEPVVEYGSLLSLIGVPAIGLGIAAKKGKLNLVDFTKSASGFLGKHTGFLKGKTVTKYTDAVAKKMSNASKGIVLNADEVKLQQILKNALSNPKDLSIQNLIDILNNPALKTMKFQDVSVHNGAKEAASMLDEIFSDKTIKLSDPQVTMLLKQFKLDFVNDFVQKGDINCLLQGFKNKTSNLSANLQSIKAQLKNAQADDWKDIIANSSQHGEIFVGILNKYGKNNLSSQKLLSIIENFEKIMDNLPKEQSKKIMDAAMQLIQEDPVKFAKAIGNKAQLVDMFRTKGVTIAMIAIPAAWAGFNLTLQFALESFLASMQKRAGRLGVMKGLEGLEDPRYYANNDSDKSVAINKKTIAQEV